MKYSGGTARYSVLMTGLWHGLVILYYCWPISLPTALPEDIARLKNVFVKTKNLSHLHNTFNIPVNKRDIDSTVQYFSMSTDPRKMRKLIFRLDENGDTFLADSVMEYAEPPAGMAQNAMKCVQ